MPSHTPPQASRLTLGLIGGVAAALVLSACGAVSTSNNSQNSSGDNSAAAVSTGPTQYPLTVQNCGTEQQFDRAPSRVVILNGASLAEVESIIALDLGDQVIANAQSYGVYDEPGMAERVDALPTVGTLSAQRDIPAETLLSLEPDLVIGSSSAAFDAGMGMATRDQLAAIGAKTLVNPDQCAIGKTQPTEEEKQDAAQVSWKSSKRLFTLLGEVFDVQAKAAELNDNIDSTVQQASSAVQSATQDGQIPNALIAVPGMSMMNASGLPAVMTGNRYDTMLEAAGTRNAFTGGARDLTRSLSPEQLAAAEVDLLVLGRFMASEDPAAEAEKIFAAYPQWKASQNKNYVVLADSIYLGPHNAQAIQKIARAAHPDAFS